MPAAIKHKGLKAILCTALLTLGSQSHSMAAMLTYLGATAGTATSSDERYEINQHSEIFYGMHLRNMPVTLEASLAHFSYSKFPGEADPVKEYQLGISSLLHIPVGDSSLYARLGMSYYEHAYQTSDNDVEQRAVILPVYGLGFDFAVVPRLNLRLEWHRYSDMQYGNDSFDIDTVRLGAFYYF